MAELLITILCACSVFMFYRYAVSKKYLQEVGAQQLSPWRLRLNKWIGAAIVAVAALYAVASFICSFFGP